VTVSRPIDTRLLDRRCLIFCLLLLGIAVAYPTLRLLFEAVRNWQSGVIFSGAGWAAIRNTFVISLASVITAGIVGTSLAFVFSRFLFRGRDALAALAHLPFALPPLVGVLSFYYLIGRDGLLPQAAERLLGIADVSLEGPFAILIVHTYSFFVFYYVMVSASIENLDAAQVEVARTLGARRLRVLTQVVLPALRPALLGAALLTFMSSVASFSAPYFFGKDFPMLSVRIYNERMQFHDAEALTLTVVLAAISLLGLILFRSSRKTGGSASKGIRAPIRSRVARVMIPALLWMVIILLLVPHLCIVWLSFVDHRAWHTELIPTHFTLENFALLIEDPRCFSPIRNSLWMSALAALLSLLTALPAGYLVGRRRPGSRYLYLIVMLPWALPGTVIAMNMIVAFNDPWLPLYNTVWLLPLAYFVRGVPLSARMAIAAIEPFDASLIEAGRSLGASRRFCLIHIVMPLLAPAFVMAATLVFVTSLGEFVSSIMLYMPANIPIAVKINMEWRGSVGAAFAYSMLLMIIVAATFAAARRLAVRTI